ncbi:DNA mismatch repair protein MutT [Pedobacter sp. HMWF019]|uniref:NUDIX domain-containing protein n=1 Tax=Pedobacter sp. HMWF019 TaxID=2056856 RepID=UPI000D386D5A|nr:NUDIX hydrolase [Pedobacter sp. HMWF019]PTS95438.1 DNA mismatch repair protein MutT [Pedobacter sp. HMWF019]
MDEKNPWTTLESRKIYENNWISLTEHDVINPSGGKGIYGQVHFKNLAIGILPLDEGKNTWLVGQYRYPLNAYSWEIPEGGGPLHLPALDSAKRELLEETGLTASHWQQIQQMHLSNSVSDELAIIYIATGLSQGESAPEETEQLCIRKLPFEEAYQMVLRNEITDSMSVAAILKTKILLDEGALNIL